MRDDYHSDGSGGGGGREEEDAPASPSATGGGGAGETMEKCQINMSITLENAKQSAVDWIDIVRHGGQRSVYTPPGWEDDAEESGVLANGASSSLPDPNSIPREKRPWYKKLPSISRMDMDFELEDILQRHYKLVVAVIVFCILLISVEIILLTGGSDASSSSSSSSIGAPGGAGSSSSSPEDIPIKEPPMKPLPEEPSPSEPIDAGLDIYTLNNNPIDTSLPSDERVAEIQTKLQAVSGPSIKKSGTTQNKAANWILHQDAFHLSPRSPYLVQRYVLALFYFAMDGSSWIPNNNGEEGGNWLDGESGECTWFGVDCDDEANVIILDLASHGLSGQLPKELSELQYLTQVYLNNNRISGEIPKEWGNLHKLEQLLLDNNYIFGVVPDPICELHNAAVLQVITADCDDDSHQVSCSCCMNCPGSNLLSPTSGIGGVGGVGTSSSTSASEENGGDHQISFESMTRSVDIAARVGEISGSLAGQVGTPQHTAMMWIIDTDAQQLDENDPHLLQRYILAALYFATGGSAWSYPSWLSKDVRECDYPGVKCSENGDITALSLSASNLSGQIPKDLAHLTSMKSLDLSSNDLDGEIPSQFSMLVNLEKLLLQDNDITGNVPDALCNSPPSTQILVDCDTTPIKVTCSCCNFCSDTTATSSFTAPRPIEAESRPIEAESRPIGAESRPIETNSEPEETGLHPAEAGSRPITGDTDNTQTVGETVVTPSETITANEAITSEETTNNIIDTTTHTTSSVTSPEPIPSDDRAFDIAEKIVSVLETAHSEPLTWIIEEDKKQLSADDPYLIQRYTLALIYYQMEGGNWTKNAKWLVQAINECEWEGIQCSSKGYVTSIILSKFNNAYICWTKRCWYESHALSSSVLYSC
mmetsp:Transcript_35168/g.53193  ORF Transcript_35168/g.53193 Transcript_35168/m.53193 type:complete len:878 (-) Transcript_35168:788-3421(-)